LEKIQKYGKINYSYDNMNRLVKVNYLDVSEELFYDRAGNRIRRLHNGVEELYSYDAGNHLTEYTKGERKLHLLMTMQEIC